MTKFPQIDTTKLYFDAKRFLTNLLECIDQKDNEFMIFMKE